MGKILILVGIGLLVLLAVLAATGVGTYNTLVSKRELVDAKWSDVAVNLQRRNDLIGNLVESVKGAMGQEQAVFGEIARARAGLVQALGTGDQQAAATADAQLTGALRGLNVLVQSEAYPQLRS